MRYEQLKEHIWNKIQTFKRAHPIRPELLIVDRFTAHELQVGTAEEFFPMHLMEGTKSACDTYMGLKLAIIHGGEEFRYLEVK